MDKTKSIIEKELEDWLDDAFHEFLQLELNFTLDDICHELSRSAEYKFPKSRIREMLVENYNITPGPSQRYVFYTTKTNREPDEQKRRAVFVDFMPKIGWMMMSLKNCFRQSGILKESLPLLKSEIFQKVRSKCSKSSNPSKYIDL